MPGEYSDGGTTRLHVLSVPGASWEEILRDFGADPEDFAGGDGPEDPPPAPALAMAATRPGFAVWAYWFERGRPMLDEDGDLFPGVACRLDDCDDGVVALSLATGHALAPKHLPAWANFVGVVDRVTGEPVDLFPVQRRAA